MSGYTLGRGASAHLLSGDRLHLQHGPINLIAKADGSPDAVRAAYARARRALAGLLEALVEELEPLRRPLDPVHEPGAAPALSSATARRMLAAAAPLADRWITPMAAVAGAVADTIAAALAENALGPELDRLFVNNGGDIALRLAPGRHIDIGVVPSLRRAVPEARLRIAAGDAVGGVATSGWDGHSFSFGIADAVTVLAADAARADAAATLIANAVDVRHPGIERRPAGELDPNSDLGQRPVTVRVPRLPAADVAAALASGAAYAQTLVDRGLIRAALLALQGRWLGVGELPRRAPPIREPLPTAV